MAQRKRYRMYVDESGDHAYRNLSCISSRFLCLVGVWFEMPRDYHVFEDGLRCLKRDLFRFDPDEPLCLHRKEIVDRKGPFGVLRDPALNAKFEEGLLELVARSTFKAVAVIIDKKTHFQKYNYPDHPYHYCVAALLDRYCGWLQHRNAEGDVLIEGRGKTEDRILQESYKEVYQQGTRLFAAPFHSAALTSKKAKIKRKDHDIAGLQLADLLAHPFRQWLLSQRGFLSYPLNRFGDQLRTAVAPKLNCQEYQGRVEGYGVVWLSDKI